MIFIGNLVTSEVDKITQRSGLTAQQYNALRILRTGYPENKPMNLKQIHSRMTFKNSDVSRLLVRLLKMEMVDCHADRTDKRVIWYVINEKGLNTLAEIDKSENEIFQAASLLTDDEARHLNLLFDKVLQTYYY